MPAENISMRKIKEILRLRYQLSLSFQQIADSLNISIATVSNYIKRAQAANIHWPLPTGMDETELQRLIINQTAGCQPCFITPDFPYIHSELKRKGVTLQLLFEEYARPDPQTAYKYSHFCELYQRWRSHLKISLRQVHRAGEKMFVDYAGQRVPIIDPITGERHQAQIFVAVLGASNYAFVEASWTQNLFDWISSHVRAFTFFQGSTEIIVPDNTRTGVSKACRYEPDLNLTYAEMASYYGTAIIPARPYKPKDKAKVEAGVLIVERWVLARLRNREFFFLAELNAAIAELMVDFNNRPFKKLPGCRLTQYELLDRPALKPLPTIAFEYAEWQKIRVGFDYHVEIDSHYYSVPYSLVKKEAEFRLSSRVVEIFYRGKRVASHIRSYQKGQKTTLFEHMPKSHQKYLEWTPSKLLSWSAEVGRATHQIVNHLFEHNPHPEMGYRASRGLVSLSRRYGTQRLENACVRAIKIGSLSYQSIANILKVGLDLVPLEAEPETVELSQSHENVRGPAYYRCVDDELIN
jgi:transposase